MRRVGLLRRNVRLTFFENPQGSNLAIQLCRLDNVWLMGLGFKHVMEKTMTQPNSHGRRNDPVFSRVSMREEK